MGSLTVEPLNTVFRLRGEEISYQTVALSNLIFAEFMTL